MQHTVTHCNTLQHTATNTLQEGLALSVPRYICSDEDLTIKSTADVPSLIWGVTIHGVRFRV